jgi:toxin ParE1/3/4
MSRIVRRKAAKTDLKEIWKYIARDSPERADAFLRQLGQKMESLAKNPLMGRERSELLPNLRSFPVGRYVIFYRPLSDGIDVVRVLSGAMDIERIFAEE